MLSAGKRREIKKILKKVNVSEICKELQVNRVSIWRTIKGEGKMFDDLIRVVERAKEIINERSEKLQSL